MVTGVEDFQKLSRESLDVAVKSFGTVSKGMQAIAAEVSDYSKKSYEDGTAAIERMMGVKSLDKAVEVQTEYMKSAYDNLMSEMTKLGEMYAGVARDAYKPFESALGKVAR